MELTWIPVKSDRDHPEAVVVCSRCNQKSFVHPNYTAEDITACVGYGRCDETEVVIKKMLALRGWQLIELTKGVDPRITFKNPSKPNLDHVCSLKYEALRKGSDCGTCIQANKGAGRVQCACKGFRGRGRPRIYEHHNHKVCLPNSAAEWDYEKNHPIRPEKVAPSSGKTFGWICSKETCREPYDQPCNYRTSGNGCPYCKGKKVGFRNSFEILRPYLAMEWHPDNTIKPHTVTVASGVNIKWKCRKCKDDFFMSPHQRTSSGAGCPACKKQGYAQIVGGHEYYVAESREMHGDKYEYPGRYVNAITKVEIVCKQLDKDGEPHGSFWQTPHIHKGGSGCSKCFNERVQSKGISMIEEALELLGFKKGATYIREHYFNDLRRIGVLKLDVWLPELKRMFKAVIEYDGEQHFRMPDHWGGEKKLEETKLCDKLKDKYCVENRISLFRIPYWLPITVESLRELLGSFIRRCETGDHLYISYREYVDHVTEIVEMNDVNVICYEDL